MLLDKKRLLAEVSMGKEKSYIGAGIRLWKRFPVGDKVAISIMLALFVLVAWIPGIYLRNTEIPPFEDLQKSSGIISFKKAGRSGWVTRLAGNNGVLTFSCWVGGRNADCIHLKEGIKNLQNKPATIWWFPRENYFTQERFIAQAEMGGVIIQSHINTLERVAAGKKVSALTDLFLLAFFIVHVGLRINSYRKQGVVQDG